MSLGHEAFAAEHDVGVTSLLSFSFGHFMTENDPQDDSFCRSMLPRYHAFGVDQVRRALYKLLYCSESSAVTPRSFFLPSTVEGVKVMGWIS